MAGLPGSLDSLETGGGVNPTGDIAPILHHHLISAAVLFLPVSHQSNLKAVE